MLPQLLERSAERRPEHPAIGCEGATLTYAELQQRSSRLARLLIEEGVRPGDRVGLYLEKSLESVVALYGAMKARAAYVPIDPMAPASRVAFILADCGIRHLVSSPGRQARLLELPTAGRRPECIVGVEECDGARCIPWAEVWRTPAAAPRSCPGTERDLAYILYTSGSTGRPKGVMHSHRSALSFVEWAAEAFEVGADDRLSNHAPFHFDLSVFDLFAAAAAAASMVIVPDDVARFPASVAELIAEERITIWYSVPYALVELVRRGRPERHDLSSLRTVLFAGEPFPPKHLRRLMRLLPQASFFNLYGPTETNVCAFYALTDAARESDEPVPIGRACPNCELLVVDDKGQEVETGARGELLVRGATTMRGYWGRPELNEAAFVPAAACGEVPFYRTGDSVRRAADGDLHFLGRKDRQIKLRGHRIELDEVEGALLVHPAVEQAAVYVTTGDDGQCRIEAAVVAGSPVSVQGLGEHLAELVPGYAVPGRITIREQLPRTSTGKIDRQGLERTRLTASGL